MSFRPGQAVAVDRVLRATIVTLFDGGRAALVKIGDSLRTVSVGQIKRREVAQ